MKRVSSHLDRYHQTLRFIKKYTQPNDKILDLGTMNPFSEILSKEGFDVSNTKGENLDDDYMAYTDTNADMVISLEIMEHMLAPYNFLRDLKSNKLIISIPLKLWFASAYWDEENDWDKHYHEFEPKQIEFLLKKTGWKIVDSEKWTSANMKKIGIRPLLRYFYPRYYIMYCTRNP